MPSAERGLRVLQLGRFWNESHGGIERHVDLLSRALAQLGVDVVNLVAAAGAQGSDTPRHGYRLVQAGCWGRFAGTAVSPALLVRAWQLHRQAPFDVVHLHLPDPLSHAVAALLPRQVKRVLTWHSDVVRQRRLMRLYQPLLNRLVRDADAVVAATAAHFTSSTQLPPLPAARCHVLPYAVDAQALALTPATQALQQQLRARAGGRPLVFALGRHVYYKGFDVLIEALRHCEAYLVLGGDGPLREAHARQVQQAGLSDRVWLPGRLAEDQLPAYYEACDVFCLPSVAPSEAFGLVQLEAMVCAKPIVNTRLNNGVNDVGREGLNALTVPVGDAVALGVALQRLGSDAALRERLGQAGRQLALQRHTPQAMAQAHLQLYRAVLSTSV